MEERKETSKVVVRKVKEARNLADMMTKAYPTYKFKERTRLIKGAKKLWRRTDWFSLLYLVNFRKMKNKYSGLQFHSERVTNSLLLVARNHFVPSNKSIRSLFFP